MRTTFLLLIFFVAATTLPGQSIVKETNLWSTVETHEPSGTVTTERIRFTEDTLINSVIYKHVERSVDEGQLDWGPYGFIREDAQKQLFYKISATATERLIFSMNHSLNDSIVVFGLFSFNNTTYLVSMLYHVTAIDSLQVGNTYRRQLHLSIRNEGHLSETGQWVDSLGSMSGMLHNWNYTVGSDYFSLLCYSENGVLQYQNPYYTSCYVLTGIVKDENFAEHVTVFPNPVTAISTVRFEGFQPGIEPEIGFYNPAGKVVLVKTGREIKISRADLAPGIYFCGVHSPGRMLPVSKIIIL